MAIGMITIRAVGMSEEELGSLQRREPEIGLSGMLVNLIVMLSNPQSNSDA